MEEESGRTWEGMGGGIRVRGVEGEGGWRGGRPVGKRSIGGGRWVAK